MESIKCVFYRGSIDDQLRLEFADFFQLGEAVAVVHKAQALGIHIVYGDFMFKTQYIGKEGAIFPAPKINIFMLCFCYLLMISICWRTLSS